MQRPFDTVRVSLTLALFTIAVCMLALGGTVQARQFDYDSRNVLNRALDVNGDGKLSPQEIDNAPMALRLLDDDGDGELSKTELGSHSRSGWDDMGDWDMGDWDMDSGGMGRGSGRPARGESRTRPDRLLDPSEVDPKDGTSTIADRATFKKLSYKKGMVMPHLKGQEFVKFEIIGAGTKTPQVYFINTETHPTHMTFMRNIGGRARDGMRGVLVRRPRLMAPNGQVGLYTFEFDLPKSHPFDMISSPTMLCRQRLRFFAVGWPTTRCKLRSINTRRTSPGTSQPIYPSSSPNSSIRTLAFCRYTPPSRSVACG